MKQIISEIADLEKLLKNDSLKQSESIRLMLKIKRLKKRLSKIKIVVKPEKLSDYNNEITNSMIND